MNHKSQKISRQDDIKLRTLMHFMLIKKFDYDLIMI